MPNKRQYLPTALKDLNTPHLDATITETWNVWDGPLSGLCKVEGQIFYFTHAVESVWRWYSKDDYERRWRIYTVYDIDLKYLKKLEKKTKTFKEFFSELEDESEVIGIFW